MALGKRRGSDSASNEEINISPLIDVVFILLIFFIVTVTICFYWREIKGKKLNKASLKSAHLLTLSQIIIIYGH